MSSSQPIDHADGHTLSRNVLWNFLGLAIPLVVALLAMPYLIAAMGTTRFGLLVLLWAMGGYVSLLDLGLGRALTRVVAEKLGTCQLQGISALVWTAVMLALLLGVASGAGLAALSPWLVKKVFTVPSALYDEALAAFYLVAAILPMVTSASILRGVLEAYQRFGVISMARVSFGAVTFVGPLLLLPFSHALPMAAGALAIARLAVCAGYLMACRRIIPAVAWADFSPRVAGQLMRQGGWMTVSNLVSPALTYLDRFLVGSLVSLAAVAYYATPFEIATSLLVIPTALSAVLFPALARMLALNRGKAAGLLERGTRYIFLALFPFILFLVTFASEGLSLWLGAEFAAHGSLVLQWLSAGVFVNSLAHIAFAFVQGSGRSDLTARMHVFELLFYMPLLWWTLERYGINGAAVLWFLRVTADTLALFAMAVRLAPSALPAMRRICLQAAGALAVIAVAGLLDGQWAKLGFFAFCCTAFAALAWLHLFDHDERAGVSSGIRTWLRAARG